MVSFMPVSWNEFRAAHKGKSTEEISDLWSQYKEGEYAFVEQTQKVEIDSVEEVSLEQVGEMFGEETMNAIAEQMANIDPNHGHDLDYIAEVEEELSIEEEFAAQNKIAEMIDEEHPQLLEDESEIKREEEEQEYLNTLNKAERRIGLKTITHW